MGNYVSIREILERGDCGLLIGLINSEVSTKIFLQLYKDTYNRLLFAQKREREREVYARLGVKWQSRTHQFRFDRVIRFGFLEEIASLKCYEFFFKDISKKHKSEVAEIFESISEKVTRNLQSFDFVTFVRYFFTFCGPKSVRPETYRRFCRDLLEQLTQRQKDSFMLYLHCSALLALMRFDFNVFKADFLEMFFKKIFSVFEQTRDQKFLAVIADILHFVKRRGDAETALDIHFLVRKAGGLIVAFLRESAKRDRPLRGSFKNSDFLARPMAQDKAKGGLTRLFRGRVGHLRHAQGDPAVLPGSAGQGSAHEQSRLREHSTVLGQAGDPRSAQSDR